MNQENENPENENSEPIILNSDYKQELKALLKDKWVKQNTAILIIHGVGHQNPIETLGHFSRTLAETIDEYCDINLELSHQVIESGTDGPDSIRFDNFIRIKRKGENFHLDVYEYFWADETEDLATGSDLQRWVVNTTKGAQRFYKENKELGLKYKDASFFFSKKGRFRALRYRMAILMIGRIIPSLNSVWSVIIKICSKIPFVFFLIKRLPAKRLLQSISNVIGDIVIYNTTDAKSNFYQVRKSILYGAVKSLRSLVEPTEKENGDYFNSYERVIVAGHSLGTQIAFDAINSLNHLVTQGKIKGVAKDGTMLQKQGTPVLQDSGEAKKISHLLYGLVTFGCPLDKIAFFLRAQFSDHEYLRMQIISDYNCFRQKVWSDTNNAPFTFKETVFPGLFDEILWKNYHDKCDLVSGGLDYYEAVENVNCDFKQKRRIFKHFTHSDYWDYKPMYADIIKSMVI